MAKSDNDFTPLALSDLGNFEPKIVGRDKLSQDDISILHDLERNNNITYNDTYVSEFLKCRNNLFYFIHNYCYIGEVGNPLLYSSNIMNRKYRRVIKSLNKYKKIILMASRQLGKALDLNTLIPTPNGFKKLCDLNVGDTIFDENGKETKIIAESPIFYDKKCYNVFFDNQTNIIASEDHLWAVSSLLGEKKVMTTRDIKTKLEKKTNNEIYIEYTKPLKYSKKYQELDPYIFARTIGDVSILQKKPTNESRDNICGNEFYKIHIPDNYLKASVYQRIKLLRGLVDSSGYFDDINNKCYLYQLNKKIVDDIIELLSSLGIKSKFYIKKNNNCDYYVVSFNPKNFYISNRKEIREKQKKIKLNENDSRIYITSIQEIKSIPCKCIMVDSPSSLFLAGEKMIPTHNSTLAACIIAHTITFFPGIRSVLFNMDQGAGIENIDKLKFILTNLPDWMKFLPDKFVKKTYVELTNGSKASVFYPSTIKSPDQIARSLTIPCLYVDEAAFIPHIERIWMSAQPTLSTASMQADKYGYPSWSVLTSTVRHVY